MRYADWAPRYETIRAEFSFPFEREEAAARTLASLLRGRVGGRGEPLARVAARLAGRDAIVVGRAPGAGAPPVWRLGPVGSRPAIVAADGATSRCLEAGLVPDVIVTDLDGPVPAEVAANGRGSLAVVHAHGDNLTALVRWVPEFPGEIVGSWAGEPREDLLDAGGFTDGDRAAYLAAEAGASRILLWGFQFDAVEEEDPRRRATKLRKLAWAQRLLGELAEAGPTPVLLWERTGALVRYGSSGSSTR